MEARNDEKTNRPWGFGHGIVVGAAAALVLVTVYWVLVRGSHEQLAASTAELGGGSSCTSSTACKDTIYFWIGSSEYKLVYSSGCNYNVVPLPAGTIQPSSIGPSSTNGGCSCRRDMCGSGC